LLHLKASGVSERVIAAMLGLASAATASISNPGTVPRRFPGEIGVYITTPEGHVDIRAEVVNWLTGGRWKSILTGGVLRGHVNGYVDSSTSALAVPRSFELIIVTEDGTDASEYQLLQLDVKGDRREFRALSMTAFRTRSGAQQNLVEFESTKLQPRTYRARLVLPAGEYGLLPPSTSGNVAMAGKLYGFTVR
jgi:hypothetical protein